MIVLDNVLNICQELIKLQNDNTEEKFYRVQRFRKVKIFDENFENLQNSKKHREKRSCSTSYPTGNQVDGSALVAIIPVQEETPSQIDRVYL